MDIMRVNNTILAVVLFAVFMGCGGEQASNTVTTPTIQCGMCQKTIEDGLKKISGVTAVTVDLKTKTTRVTYDIQKTDIAKIEKVISSLGYQANETQADPHVYDALPGCCKVSGWQ